MSVYIDWDDEVHVHEAFLITKGSDKQYLHIDIPDYGRVTIKREDEGLVIDVYPLEEKFLEEAVGSLAMTKEEINGTL